MMKKIIVVILIVLFGFFVLYSEKINIDKPAKGDLNLKIQKVWGIEDAGEDPFARINTIKVMKDRIFIYDNKNLRVYIVDQMGKPLGAFGKKGEGPGEMTEIRTANMFLAGDKLVMAETGKIHIFEKNGEFLKKINNPTNRQPLVFIDEHQFITAPIMLQQAPSGKGKIRKINIRTGKEELISDFVLAESASVTSNDFGLATFTDISITPMMVIGYSNNHLFYGMNDKYRVNISDMKGKVTNIFGMKRKRRAISNQLIEDKLIEDAKDQVPVALLKRLAKAAPNIINYFDKIEMINDMYFVYSTYYDQKNIQQIDIFSKTGEYLYKAFIRVSEEYVITNTPVNKYGYLYLGLEDEDGIQTVNKYNIKIPTN